MIFKQRQKRRTTLIVFALCSLFISKLTLAQQIVPYLQSATESSIWVSWKTASGEDSRVEYGLSADKLDKSNTGNTQTLEAAYKYHTVQMNKLQADTQYYYRVSTGTDTSDIYNFKTPPVVGEKNGHIRFLVMGDHQIRGENRYEQLVGAAKRKIEQIYGVPISESINLVINDGDQVDVGTLDHYENLHFAQSAAISPYLPIMTTVGNHEYYYDGDLARYQAHFIYDGLSYQGIPPAANESYYAYQTGRVLFIHMNSMKTDATQEAWLRKIVEAGDKDESVDWMISVIHHPYQAEQYIGDISKKLRESWMEILASSRKHVLNIAGHHHLYARGQTRDWPIYHMISGGTAWDQYWGQSNEQDYDDVQKTIANWAWQLVDIDIATKNMTVETYAEAHPIVYKTEGFHLNSKLIDKFHRNLDGGQPNKPSIVNEVKEDITLPYTFESSAFHSNYSDELNSTQFQIASDAQFNNLSVDKIRDYENIYGDSGAPLYEPVDIHKGVNILNWTIKEYTLPNGNYFIRTRHRDSNTEWSDWSDSVSFKVTGSTNGVSYLSTTQSRYETGDDVVVNFTGGRGNPKDWIGIYAKGQKPGAGSPSVKWKYVSSSAGQVTFDGLADGEYFVAFFGNDSYDEIAPRANFSVGPVTTLSLSKTKFDEGETVKISWENGPANAKDWIGIYRIGQTPGNGASTLWRYTPTNNGSVNFNGLEKGYYYATFLINDGYTEVSERVNFSIGSEISNIALDKQTFAFGEDIVVTFSDSPGTPKDYLGIFAKDAIPGQTGSELFAYVYFDGAISGKATFVDNKIPAGEYFVAMYSNDSYDQVSNRVCFVVGDVQGCGQQYSTELTLTKESYYKDEAVTLEWSNSPGNEKDWIGIYKENDVPGPTPSTKWRYLNGTSGKASFEGLDIGKYFAVILINDGYKQASLKVPFSVISKPELQLSKDTYFSGETVVVSWSNTSGNAKDWIGIYKAGATPGVESSIDWSYLNATEGSANFNNLPIGDYFAIILKDDGYEPATPKIPFSIVAKIVAGDINGDGEINKADGMLLRNAMGKCEGDSGYASSADLNTDGCVNYIDYRKWLAIFRQQ